MNAAEDLPGVPMDLLVFLFVGKQKQRGVKFSKLLSFLCRLCLLEHDGVLTFF